MNPGSIVAWWDGATLVFGVVEAEERDRLRLFLGRGKPERVKASRVVATLGRTSGTPAAHAESRKQSAAELDRIGAAVRRRAESIDVALLWEVVTGDGADAGSVSVDELAALGLETDDPEGRVALLQALADDGLHFVRRGDRWETRPQQAVVDLRVERSRVAEREQETGAVFVALRDAVQENRPYRATGSDHERRILDALERLAILEDDAPRASVSVALEALEASGQRFDRPSEGAFRLLRRAGRFESDDENLQVRRYAFRCQFPDDVLSHAETAAATGFDRRGREDRTDLEMVSIDDVATSEIDDALSVEAGPEGAWRLGVHIADPAAFVAIGDPVDVEAQSRAVTHYMPDLRLTMLPPGIAERAASLVEGEDRPALSFYADVAADGSITGHRVVRSVVRCKARLSYEDFDHAVETGEGRAIELLRSLERIATVRERFRAAAGAIQIHAREVEPRVGQDGQVILHTVEPGTAARRAVTEAMVTAGDVAARHCVAEGIPVIYRRQPAPAEVPDVPEGGARDPVSIWRVRRSLRRGEPSLHPGPHYALGLGAYAQVTSPLRRYQDLTAHRQIIAGLEGNELPFGEEPLQRIAATTEQVEIDARRAERATEDYWLLRWLEAKVGKTVDAVVLETEPRTMIQLAETLRTQPLPGLKGVEPGQAMPLLVQHVNPRAGRLVLRVSSS